MFSNINYSGNPGKKEGDGSDIRNEGKNKIIYTNSFYGQTDYVLS